MYLGRTTLAVAYSYLLAQDVASHQMRLGIDEASLPIASDDGLPEFCPTYAV